MWLPTRSRQAVNRITWLSAPGAVELPVIYAISTVTWKFTTATLLLEAAPIYTTKGA
jgi:hypothetical protein